VARRPNEPPAQTVLIFTCSGLSPRIAATVACSTVWNCAPAQISAVPSPLTSMTPLSGSIGAWARYGKENSASITLAAPLSADAVSPRRAAARPGFRASLRYSANIASLDRFSAALSSHSILSASRPFIADQVSRASTATPCGICTTSTTPLTALAAAASKVFTVPPKRGERAITAVSMPGRRTSIA
jgi:hypothetical protein